MSQTAPFIVVVDDDESVGRALQRLLRAEGFDVERYTSGEAFFGSLSDATPDCLVLDLHMPGINGFQIQERLSSVDAGIPVVVITGHDSPGSREIAFNSGAAAYLTKPVDGQSLIDAINDAMAM